MTITIPEEYAELMKPNGHGNYLYIPQRFSELHPGAVGFFDKYGLWNTITDLSVPGRPEKDGYKAPSQAVYYDKPSESVWKTTTSSKEAEASFGLTGGLSGALTAAPVDVSAEAKNKWGKTGKAALITDDSVVVNEFLKAPCRDVITDWVKQNAQTLVKGPWGSYIKDYGLWAIKKTWSTQECAITMTSAHNRDTSAGIDVGATGIGKVGTSGSSTSKSNNEGWTTYKASEEDKALVVSYGGASFRLHRFKMFHSKNPLTQVQREASDSVEYAKPVFDENGNQTGVEFFRPVCDENGNVVGEQKIDREVEQKAREEEQKKLEEENAEFEEEVVVEGDEVVGEDESEAEAEREAARALAERRKKFSQKVMTIHNNPELSEEQKRQAFAALLAADVTVTTTTIPA
ncbi:hypothetical protein N7520_006366 [Penicillium odoratum]|uniref:uncharacterized protein n=1 Tax=Penicillium odoratum TaxID=1167516 RepID=UPI0025492A08|nr:uncharacterized protein N7520_006366 [Penicillium odoratum]KAJ5759210.1 hypothetical protein N7520_006366 [Penicillium odoratum]